MLFLRNTALCRVGEKRYGFHPDFNLIFTEPIVMKSIKSTLSNHEPKIYHCGPEFLIHSLVLSFWSQDSQYCPLLSLSCVICY